MESSNHSTSEPQDLLEGTATLQILSSFPFDYFHRAFGSLCP